MSQTRLAVVPQTDRAAIAQVFLELGATTEQIVRAVRVVQNLDEGIERANSLHRRTRRLLWLNYVLSTIGIVSAALVPGVWWRSLFSWVAF